MCDGGQCVECENDGHCPSGQWCKNKDFPLILNDCVNKLGNGAWCVRDAQCHSGTYTLPTTHSADLTFSLTIIRIIIIPRLFYRCRFHLFNL